MTKRKIKQDVKRESEWKSSTPFWRGAFVSMVTVEGASLATKGSVIGFPGREKRYCEGSGTAVSPGCARNKTPVWTRSIELGGEWNEEMSHVGKGQVAENLTERGKGSGFYWRSCGRCNKTREWCGN